MGMGRVDPLAIGTHGSALKVFWANRVGSDCPVGATGSTHQFHLDIGTRNWSGAPTALVAAPCLRRSCPRRRCLLLPSSSFSELVVAHIVVVLVASPSQLATAALLLQVVLCSKILFPPLPHGCFVLSGLSRR